jgi:hypothetical protein
MKKSLNKTFMKIAIPLAVVWGVIVIAKSGYAFGQWLFAMIH